MLAKQAKTLSSAQVKTVLLHLDGSRNPIRNRLIFLLSTKAGLRAKEIAELTWRMVTDAEGEVAQEIRLENSASKGLSGGVIAMNGELRQAFVEWRRQSWVTKGTSKGKWAAPLLFFLPYSPAIQVVCGHGGMVDAPDLSN